MKDNKQDKKFTWLGFFNFFILQWFFIRLFKYNIEISNEDVPEIWKYKIIKWIIPLTGWNNDYKYLNKSGVDNV